MVNKKVLNVNYIGESAIFLENLKSDMRFKIQNVFCKDTRINKELIDSAKELLCPIGGKEDLAEKIINKLPKVDFNIIYSCPIIIPQSLIEIVDFYNIHPGSLYDNRGRNPIVWSLILGNDRTVITLHKIAKEIDCGIIISEKEVFINEDEKFSTLKHKLESKFKSLLDDLYAFIIDNNNVYKIAKNGIYRKKITEADITIDVQHDTYKIIKRKINSQDMYDGALLTLNNNSYRISSIISEQDIVPKKFFKKINVDLNNETIKIYTEGKLLETKFRRI